MSDTTNKNRSNRRHARQENQDNVMAKTRELTPIMAQTSDSLGSYTGSPVGESGEKPVQDADDL